MENNSPKKKKKMEKINLLSLQSVKKLVPVVGWGGGWGEREVLKG